MRKIFSKTNSVALVLLLLLSVSPSVAYADDIFDLIQHKMLSTVMDLRKIAYVIAGFGLIMFSVLAVFNKISFKHLGYIMISLSLLALLMPFIEYFTGAKLKDEASLNYANYIKEEQASFAGTDPDLFEENGDAPLDDAPLDAADGIISSEAGDAFAQEGLGGMKGPKFGDDGKENGFELAGLAETANTVEEEKKSFKDRAKNFIDKAKDAVDMVHDGIDSVQHGKEAVAGAITGAQKVVEAAKKDGDFFDKVGSVSAAIEGATSDVSSDLIGVTGNTKKVADYFKPDNSVSDVLDGIAQDVKDDRDDITDLADMGRYLDRVSDRAQNADNRIKKIFGKK